MATSLNFYIVHNQLIINAKPLAHSFQSSEVIVCLMCHCFHRPTEVVLDNGTEALLVEESGGGLNSYTVETCKE